MYKSEVKGLPSFSQRLRHFLLIKKTIRLLLLLQKKKKKIKCRNGIPNKLFFKKTKSLPLGVFYNLLCSPTLGFYKPVSLLKSHLRKKKKISCSFFFFFFADRVHCVLSFLVSIGNIYMFYVLCIMYIYNARETISSAKVNSLRMYSIIYCSVTDRMKKI